MAEGLAREMFGASVQVSSAGIEACVGLNANAYALEVLKEHKVDLARHRSRRISAELMADADWIIPMTQAQEEALSRHYPQYIEKIRYLGDWGEQKRDVIDPWNGSLNIYRQTAHEIRGLLSGLKGQLNKG